MDYDEREYSELRLLELIKNSNRSLAAQYFYASLKELDEIERRSLFDDYRKIQIRAFKDDSCFRIQFNNPVLVLVSHAISRFRMRKRYYKSDMGFIPLYLANVNLITMLKTYGSHTLDFFSPHSRLVQNSDFTCIAFVPHSERKMELSSMNFLLQHDMTIESVEGTEKDLMVKYFRYLYWNIPRLGFPNFVQFFHDYNRITMTMEVSKSLFAIDHLGRMEEVVIDGISMRIKEATIRCLTLTEKGYVFQRFNGYVDDVTAATMQHLSNEYFVNGLLYAVTFQGRKYKILTGSAELASSVPTLFKNVLGIVISNRFDVGPDLAAVGTVSDVTHDALEIISEMGAVGRSAITDCKDTFVERILKELYPCVITDDRQVYFIHPVIVMLLMKYEKLHMLDGTSPVIVNVAKLLAKVRESRMEIRLLPEMENLRQAGFNTNNLLSDLSLIANKIEYSRILKRY
ncbi:MAG: hypothetical protein HMLIMOIP_000932 [Candidatus Nitrosomirales archaeon]|jgi:hypothetical protein